MIKKLLLLIMIGFCCKNNFAQQIHNLVFEGAGIRGLAYSGAITELEKKNILPGVKRVAGTSAGAITALMLSLGYNANEITEIISNTKFKKFNDGNLFFAGGIFRTSKYFGWYRGNQFEKWLSNIIKAKTGSADITFSQLKQAGFKDLYITGTSLNKQQLFIFSFESFPNMKVKDAVRISMSIPVYFEAVFMDDKGKVFHHPKNKKELHVMVDGGFIANFPIKIFDSTKYLSQQPNSFTVNKHTLGFRIDRKEQVINDEGNKELAPMPVTNFNEYTAAFYNFLIENLNRQNLTAEDWERTISISDGEIGPRIKKLKSRETYILIENGRSATESFFKTKH